MFLKNSILKNMVGSKVFEKYYNGRPLIVKLKISNPINVYINKVIENEYGDVVIDCFYNEKDRPKFITHGIISFFTKKQIIEQSKIFSMDGYITVNLNKL